MQSFDCLAPKTEMEGRLFLEASAGTGKTFAIEHVVCRLLLKGIPPQKILITTFTRASTRDLRLRIYKNLRQTLLELSGDHPPKLPYLQELEDRQEAALRIKTSLCLIDEMPIYTICSFCYRMLTELGFEAKIDLSLKDPEQEHREKPIRMATLDCLRTLVHEDQFSPNQLRRLMHLFQKDVGRLVKRMVQILENNPKLPPEEKPFSEVQKEFSSIHSRGDIEKLVDELYGVLPNYKKTHTRAGELHEYIENQVQSLLNGDLDNLILASPSIFTLLDESNQKLGKKEAAPFTMRSIFEKFKELIVPASDPNRVLIQLAHLVQKRLSMIEIASPDFFLETMYEAIQTKSFCHHVQKKYDCLIIDEFQDTDPLSWSVFQKLFMDQAKLFMVVGDPKQSIYAFRGADLATFVRAKSSFGQTYALDTNYRSSSQMISILNQLFDQKKIPGLFSFDPKVEDVSYRPIHAGKIDESSTNSPAVHIPLFPGKRKRSKSFPSQEMEETSFFPYIVKEVQRLQKGGTPLSEIAILVKDRFVAARLMATLQRYGISSLSQATDSIASTDCFSLFSLLFELLERPRSLSLAKQVLSHPLIGWPLEALERTIEDETLQEFLEAIFHLRKSLLEEGPFAAYRKILELPVPKATLAQRVAKDPMAYSHMLQLLSLVIEYEQTTPLETIQHLATLDPDTNPQLKVKALIEGEAVSILTSHMSKGLEFGIVFALGISYRMAPRKDFIRDEKGEMRRFQENDPQVHEALVAQDREKMRLFYVALTRAKDHLYIIGSIDEGSNPLEPGSASPFEIYLARALSSEFLPYEELYEKIATLDPAEVVEHFTTLGISSAIEECVDPIQQESADTDIILQQPTLLPPPPTHQISLSFSSLTRSHDGSLPWTLTSNENDLPHGPEVGTLLHLILEKIIEEGVYYFGSEEDLDCYIQEELVATPLFDWKEEICEIVNRAFSAHITPDQAKPFALRDVHPSFMLQEMRFAYPLEKDKAIMKGFVDLYFFHEGKYYILDWKMNKLPQYDQETIQTVISHHSYDLQAQIYAHGLQRHLEKTETKPFEELFGGSIYFFLRGYQEGVYHFFPLHNEINRSTIR